MMLESAFLYLIAGGLLCAHLATLRLLYACRRHATDFTEQISGEGAFMSGRMEEVCRIGSDIADTLEAIAKCGLEDPLIEAIDVNPIVISGNRPVAVDALVIKS